MLWHDYCLCYFLKIPFYLGHWPNTHMLCLPRLTVQFNYRALSSSIIVQLYIINDDNKLIHIYPTSTLGIRCIQPPDVFSLTPVVNKSCNIQCCVNKMLQIIQNMMVSQGLELELSMFRRTTIYIYQVSVYWFRYGSKIYKSIQPPLPQLPLKYNWRGWILISKKFRPVPKPRDADLI